MKPRAKLMMLLLSLAMLAGAWLLAESMSAGEEPEAAEALAEPALFDLSVGPARALTALSWSYDGETVNLVRGETGVWTNADDETCPIDDAAVQAMALAVSGAAADMAISDVTDLAQYGLAEPQLTIVAATAEKIASYEIGNMSITGEYYLRCGGDTVYLETGALAPAFRTRLSDILALEAVPTDIAAVTELSVHTEAESYELRFSTEEKRWLCEDGGADTVLETERVRELYDRLLHIDLSRCVTWNAEDPALYGLDAPQGTATVAYFDAARAKKAFMLEFGAYEEGDVYARFAGSDMVYLTDAAVLDALMYPAWQTMLPLEVLSVEPDEVARLQLTFGGHSYDIARLRETTVIIVAGEPVETTDIIYSASGWVLDTEKMDAWLTALSALSADDAAQSAEGRGTILSVRIVWEDETAEDSVLEVRNYDSAHYLCAVDERRLLVARRAVDGLITDAESILILE